MPEEQTKKEESSVDVSALLAKVEALEKKDAENQEKLKLLYEVADKGRLMNYEAGKANKKPLFVKLSRYQGKIIVGWRTVKDMLVKHPTTGAVVGEEQEYEVLLLDEEGKIGKAKISGYPAFSDARYSDRIEVEVVGKKEDFDGKVEYDVRLPDGRITTLDVRFVN